MNINFNDYETREIRHLVQEINDLDRQIKETIDDYESRHLVCRLMQERETAEARLGVYLKIAIEFQDNQTK